MTREEALYKVKGYLTDIIPAEDYSEVDEIIKALEQEPCEPFNTKYPTWIIAFCPDTNSFFVTNQRYFFWQSEKEFNSENDGVNYFEHNISYFIDIANEIIHTKHTKKVWLENTSKWYKL